MSWFADDPADCGRKIARGGWGEDLALQRCEAPIGPRNAYSNAAYPLAGWVLPFLAGWTPATLVMATTLTMLGYGSYRYHAYKTVADNNLDRAGMYLVFGALAACALAPAHDMIALAMVTWGVVLATLFTYVIKSVNLDLQMGLLLGFAGTGALLHGDAGLAGISMLVFLAAYAAWQLNKSGRLVPWGHAIWHVFTAVAIDLMYLALITGGARPA